MSELEVGELTKLLLEAQSADGGWGSGRGQSPNTEATSFALLALGALRDAALAPRIDRGIAWLVARQRGDGSWPLRSGLEEGSWATSLAILALARRAGQSDRVLRAGKWLLIQEGRGFGWFTSLLFRLLPEERRIRLDPDLVGWPWHSGSFSWVEPTAFALLALKKLRPRLEHVAAEKRIRQGELLLYDRVCQGGGWNYGNSAVLGEQLWAYPEVTAVVLIALQDRASEAANQQSLAALEAMLAPYASGLSLAWSMLCFSLYGREVGKWRQLLAERYAAAGFIGETRTVALALLALADETGWLRV